MSSVLAPFRNRDFRFQWPADLATSWAFEMETLILGWYVLVETGSVFLLAVFVSLQQMGTLVAPMFGVVGDRIGQRNLLFTMRAMYATLATVIMVLAFTGHVTPLYVLVCAGIIGMVKPSDVGARTAFVGDIMPGPELMGAMSIQRTTMDSARAAGALAGAGLVAWLGMGWAYAVVASLYGVSAALTLNVRPHRQAATADSKRTTSTRSPWRDLRAGLAYVRRTPHLFAAMLFAFALNLTAYPQMMGLMPYVAKEVHHADQAWLSYLTACASAGALIGSLLISRRVGTIRPARTMLVFSALWYLALLAFANWPHVGSSLLLLVLAGWAQSTGQIPMATMLVRTTDEQFRGRVMGIRMLAIYGNIPGVLLAGPLIAALGYPAMATIYNLCGLAGLVAITVRWRSVLWDRTAPANRK